MLEVKLKTHSELIARVLRPSGGNLSAVNIGKGSEHTKCVANARTLNLNNLSAEVGKHGCGKGHCHEGAGADNSHSGKGTVLRDDEFTFTHFVESPYQ